VRYHVEVVHAALRIACGVILAGSAVAGFERSLDALLIDQARAIGQSRIEASRVRFHQPYRLPVARPPIDYIDIVTPFRRIVLLAEDRARTDGRMFGQRDALALAGDKLNVLDVVVALTFHPFNVFIGVPAYQVMLSARTPPSMIEPTQVARIPRFGARLEGAPPPSSTYVPLGGPGGGSEPMLGGTVVAGFDAHQLSAAGAYDVVISENGRELARTRLDLAGLR
jgi:hypothetical protein